MKRIAGAAGLLPLGLLLLGSTKEIGAKAPELRRTQAA
jgi:hypothetical protein